MNLTLFLFLEVNLEVSNSVLFPLLPKVPNLQEGEEEGDGEDKNELDSSLFKFFLLFLSFLLVEESSSSVKISLFSFGIINIFSNSFSNIFSL